MFSWLLCILSGHTWGSPVHVLVAHEYEAYVVACRRCGAARCYPPIDPEEGVEPDTDDANDAEAAD